MEEFKRDFFNDKFNVDDKVIILTGATGLLGTQYTKYLTNLGAKVVAVDIVVDGIEKLKKENVKEENLFYIEADITKEQDVEKILKKSLEKFGRIDVLVNNACFNPRTPQAHASLENFSLEIWNKFVDVNLTGIFLCSKIIGSWMAKHKAGVIVNVASTYGIVGADQRIYGDSKINSSIAYAATKSGVLNITRWLASYWSGKNVRVNTLSPGGVFNNQSPEFVKNYNYKTMVGRMADKDEYTGALLFLISDASSYMNGSNLIVDGGWTAW